MTTFDMIFIRLHPRDEAKNMHIHSLITTIRLLTLRFSKMEPESYDSRRNLERFFHQSWNRESHVLTFNILATLHHTTTKRRDGYFFDVVKI